MESTFNKIRQFIVRFENKHGEISDRYTFARSEKEAEENFKKCQFT